MTALMQAATQTRTAVSPKLASGGLPPRQYVHARGGGGGGGSNGGGGAGDFDTSGGKLTEAEYNDISEELKQRIRYEKCKVLDEQVKTAQEAVNTAQQKTAAQQERTQTAQQQVELARMATQMVQSKQQTAQINIQVEQERMNTAQVQLQIAEMTTYGTKQQGGAMWLLRQSALQSMNLKIQEQNARNEHQQEWLELAGWSGNRLPQQSFGRQSFGGGAKALGGSRADSFLDAFNSSSFKLRPINGLGRSW